MAANMSFYDAYDADLAIALTEKCRAARHEERFFLLWTLAMIAIAIIIGAIAGEYGAWIIFLAAPAVLASFVLRERWADHHRVRVALDEDLQKQVGIAREFTIRHLMFLTDSIRQRDGDAFVLAVLKFHRIFNRVRASERDSDCRFRPGKTMFDVLYSRRLDLDARAFERIYPYASKSSRATISDWAVQAMGDRGWLSHILWYLTGPKALREWFTLNSD